MSAPVNLIPNGTRVHVEPTFAFECRGPGVVEGWFGGTDGTPIRYRVKLLAGRRAGDITNWNADQITIEAPAVRNGVLDVNK